MSYPPAKLTIKSWADEDRPREKLLLKGKQALSDAELLAILIGSGSQDESAVDLCKRIFSEQNHDLNQLGRMSVKELCKYKGIGEAKAISIVAALELGRRRQSADIRERKTISSSKDGFEYLAPYMMDLPHEEFWILHLNRANKVIAHERISLGGTAGTIVDIKIVMRKALENLASGIIVAHNHPSGNLRASQADLKLTGKLKQACQLMDINLLDHLIITDNGYYSLADEGQI